MTRYLCRAQNWRRGTACPWAGQAVSQLRGPASHHAPDWDGAKRGATRSLQAYVGSRAPGWSPTAEGQRARAAWSRPPLTPTPTPCDCKR